MNKSIHQKETEKLRSLEHELIDLIASTENKHLMCKFIEWQDQRAKCNESFMREIGGHSKCLRDKTKACDLCHECDVNALNPGISNY